MATSPARARQPYSEITTAVEEPLEPGVVQLNYLDRKIHGANPSNGLAVLLSQLLREWQSTIGYKTDDLCIYQQSIYRATRDTGPVALFDATAWEALSATGRIEISEPYPTSLVSGGLITQATPTSVQIAAGSGFVNDTTAPDAISSIAVAWSTFTVSITDLGGRDATVLAIDGAGSLQQYDFAAFTNALRRSAIVLGWVLHDRPNTQIEAVYPAPIVGAQDAAVFLDEYQVFGGAYKVRGRRLGTRGDLGFDLSDGVHFALNHRWHVEPTDPSLIDTAAQAPATFDVIDRNFNVIGAAATVVDPTQWDDGGTLTAVPAGQVTIQYLFGASNGSAIYLQLGQAVYTNFFLAISGLQDDLVAFARAGPAQSGILLGAIIIAQDCAATNDTNRCSLVTSLDGAVEFLPEGAFDDSGLLDLAGTRAMTGNLDLGGNQINNAYIDGGTF